MLLVGAGIVRGRAQAVSAAGLALVTGCAATGIADSLMLVAGLGATVPEVGGAWIALGLAGAAAARLVPGAPARAVTPAARSVAAMGGLAVVGGYLAALLGRSLVPLGHLSNDAWTQWLMKAKIVYFFGGLDTGAAGWTQQANPDYPPLDPALEATALHFAGRADFLALPFLHWIVFASFFAALAYLLRPHVAPALLWPSLAMLVLAPKLAFLVGSSLADEPLALFVTMAGICGVIWLLEDDARPLGLSALFLAAAALTKNEGLLLGLVLALVLGVASRRCAALALAAAPILANVPWRLWLDLHDVPPNFAYHWSRILHPVALAQHTAYLDYGARSLLGSLFAPSQWLLIVPVTLLIAAVAAVRRQPIGLITIAFATLAVGGFSLVYWLGNGVCTWAAGYTCDGTWRDVEWLVANSADRIVAAVALLLAALFPLVVAAATRAPSADATPRPARDRATAAAGRALPRG